MFLDCASALASALILYQLGSYSLVLPRLGWHSKTASSSVTGTSLLTTLITWVTRVSRNLPTGNIDCHHDDSESIIMILLVKNGTTKDLPKLTSQVTVFVHELKKIFFHKKGILEEGLAEKQRISINEKTFFWK